MIDITSEKLLEIFATSNDSDERIKTLSELMSIKAIPKKADDPRFGLGLDRWVQIATDLETEPREKLLAIAELIRATQQLKKRQPILLARVKQVFEQPLPPLVLIEDAETRLNIARACSMNDAVLLQSYRAACIAREVAPKPRIEMMAGIAAKATSIAEVLDLLTVAFDDLKPETEKPAESMAKRLARTLEAFRNVVLSSSLQVGPDVGKKLDQFIRVTFTATGRPKEEDVQLDLTKEIVLTLHDLVKSRFSLAMEPQTFLPLIYCRSFFSGISWPKELNNELNFLIQDLTEALLIIARMGLPNQELFNQLELACGVKDRARFIASQLAEKNTEIDESIRNWLRTGRMVNAIAPSEVLQDSLLTDMEEALGMALIKARLFKINSDCEQRLTSSLEIFDPALVSLFKDFVSHSFEMFSAIEDLASRRALDLMGNIGDEVEFTPKYFEMLGGLSSSKGVVLRPAIVKVTSVGAFGGVVKKGLVR